VFASLSQTNSNQRTIPVLCLSCQVSLDFFRVLPKLALSSTWVMLLIKVCEILSVLMMRNYRPGCRNRLFLWHPICCSTNRRPSLPSSTASSKRTRRHFGKPDSECMSPGKSLPSALHQRRLRQRGLSFPQCLQTLGH
jgi:hypothetical protein